MKLAKERADNHFNGEISDHKEKIKKIDADIDKLTQQAL